MSGQVEQDPLQIVSEAVDTLRRVRYKMSDRSWLERLVDPFTRLQLIAEQRSLRTLRHPRKGVIERNKTRVEIGLPAEEVPQRRLSNLWRRNG